MTKKAMEPKSCPIIALVGISGSGKTTLGRIVAQRLGYAYIELDDWFKRDKPVFVLSNGQAVKNWDRMDVIDWAGFEYQVKEACKVRKGVVIAGFALRKGTIPGGADVTILLRTGQTPRDVIERTIQARRTSKGFTGNAAKKDELVVREIVFPFYQKTVEQLPPHVTIDVFDQMSQRIPIETLVDQIITIAKY